MSASFEMRPTNPEAMVEMRFWFTYRVMSKIKSAFRIGFGGLLAKVGSRTFWARLTESSQNPSQLVPLGSSRRQDSNGVFIVPIR